MIGRITMTGTFTGYPLPMDCGGPLRCSPSGITAGPDGALWFVEAFGDKVGRITTAGVISEFPLTNKPAGPRWIAPGPDGALWFPETDGNKIGRITVGGVISEYPLPTDCGNPGTGCRPFGITAGTDGAMWFTELNGNKIGRITTAGLITEYPLPPGRSPYLIASGPDGALWFTAVGNIGRITTAGALTEYPVGSLRWEGITAGLDGAIWFGSTNTLARITTAGVVTSYPLPDAEHIYGITVGPDGALWFAEFNGKIASAPACALGLRASYAGTTLTMSFALGLPTPSTWNTGYFSQQGLIGLWSQPVPALAPPYSLTVPWGPGFPSQGEIAIASTLKHPSNGEFLCAEWQILNTGGAGATRHEIEHMLRTIMPRR